MVARLDDVQQGDVLGGLRGAAGGGVVGGHHGVPLLQQPPLHVRHRCAPHLHAPRSIVACTPPTALLPFVQGE